MRDAGAIILAKTAMPDFATSWFGYCSAIGATKNPYDLGRDPGGSSGGTGCAVAANLGAIGLGEDTGGSARLPASFDNLVGLQSDAWPDQPGRHVAARRLPGFRRADVSHRHRPGQTAPGHRRLRPRRSLYLNGAHRREDGLRRLSRQGRAIGQDHRRRAFGLRRFVQSRRGGGQRGRRGCPRRAEGRGCRPCRCRNPRSHGIHRVFVALHQSFAERDRRVHGVPPLVAAGKHSRALRCQAVSSGARSVRGDRAGSGGPLFGSGVLSALHDPRKNSGGS